MARHFPSRGASEYHGAGPGKILEKTCAALVEACKIGVCSFGTLLRSSLIACSLSNIIKKALGRELQSADVSKTRAFWRAGYGQKGRLPQKRTDCHSIATRLPSDCQVIAKLMSGRFQSQGALRWPCAPKCSPCAVITLALCCHMLALCCHTLLYYSPYSRKHCHFHYLWTFAQLRKRTK